MNPSDLQCLPLRDGTLILSMCDEFNCAQVVEARRVFSDGLWWLASRASDWWGVNDAYRATRLI